MKNVILSHILFLAMWQMGSAQWLNLNPGHGGRVQGLSCYNKIPGRMFVGSDMEGFYVTSDYGENWKYIAQNAPTSLAIYIQQSGNRVLYGSFEGLSYTDNMGQTFTEASGAIDGEPIGIIEVDPVNEKRIYAAPQWLIQFTRRLPILVEGPQVIYVSDDRGTTWTQRKFAQGDGYRRVNSINIHPNNRNEIIVSSGTGMYRSTNGGQQFTKVNPPAGTDGPNNTIGECMGADFTADGKWLYAIFQKKGNTLGDNKTPQASHLFVKSYPNGQWKDLGLAGEDDLLTYWQPQVWKGGPANEHYVLTSQLTQGRNDGLYEGRFTVNGNNVSGEIVEIFDFNKQGRGISTDAGWNQYVVNQSRNKKYWPAEWGGNWNSRSLGNVNFKRGVLTMSQQSFFVGDASRDDYWDVQNCTHINTLPNGNKTYRTNGTQSTFTYDMMVYKNYVIMGQADNGMLESFDYGFSWTQAGTPNHQGSHSYALFEGNPALMIACNSFGWGGGNPGGNAQLLYKWITTTDDQADSWTTFVDGKAGEPTRKGFPPNRAWQMIADPSKPYRLYAGTQAGVYVCEDIRTLVDDNPNNDQDFYEIWGFGDGRKNSELPVNDMVLDPTNPNIMYLKCQYGNLKGTKQANGDWVWERSTGPDGRTNYFNAQGNTDGGVEVTQVGGNLLTFTTRQNPELGNNLRRHDIMVAVNGSTEFKRVIYWQDALATMGTPAWFIPEVHDLEIGDFAVYKNKIYVPYSVWQVTRKGFGMIVGTILPDGTVTNLQRYGADGSDAELEYSVAHRIRVLTDDRGVTSLFMATKGGGLTAKVIEQGDGNQSPAVSITSPANGATINSGAQIQIRANAVDPDGNITKVEFFNGPTKLGQDNNKPYQFNWNNAPDGSQTIRVVATDNKGAKGVAIVNVTVGQDNGGDDGDNGGDDGGNDGDNGSGDCGTSPAGKPNPPCNVWAEALSATSARVHWEDNSNNETKFDIHKFLQNDKWRGGGIADAPANATSIDVTGLVSGGRYKFRVKAVGSNGGSVWTESDFITLGGNNTISVTGVNLTPANATLNVNQTRQLTATVAPNNATNKNVSYSSSNTSVATVNASGLVTAKAQGTATITVTTADGGKTDQTNITVNGSSGGGNQGNGDCSATSPGGKPNPPCNVWAEAISATSARVRWKDNSNNETKFDIHKFLRGDKWRGGGIPDASANANSLLVTGLSNGGKYKFRVKAVGSNGGSVWVEADEIDLSSAARFGNSISSSNKVRKALIASPIPNNGVFTLEALSNGSGVIVDAMGRAVKSINYLAGVNRINITGVMPGMYILISDTNDQRIPLLIK